MRMGTSHSLAEAFSPWGKQSLLPRVVQPFGVETQTATPIAGQQELGGSADCASFIIPFWPFEIIPFAGSSSASWWGSLDTDHSIAGVTHERGKISQGLGKFSHERS